MLNLNIIGLNICDDVYKLYAYEDEFLLELILFETYECDIFGQPKKKGIVEINPIKEFPEIHYRPMADTYVKMNYPCFYFKCKIFSFALGSNHTGFSKNINDGYVKINLDFFVKNINQPIKNARKC